jgi:tetratricopeptide (TPR) repeat protein
MNIYRYILCAFALCLTSGAVVAAEKDVEAEAEWNEAITAYGENRYADAVDAFQRVADLGYGSANLYYNLGDAWFKLGQQNIASSGRPFAGGELGKAIVNYRRALRLNPAMEDARYNLDIARDYTNDTEPLPVSFIASLWRSLRDMLTANGWTAIQLVMLATALAFALGYLLSRRVSLRKVCFAVAVIAALICLLSTALALSSRSAAEKHETAVVVCSDTTPVHASPDSASKIIRQPSQGVTVGIVREHDGWTEISFADGEKGWIRTNLIETV